MSDIKLYFLSHIVAFVLGFFLDLIVGDPHWLYHPVRIIGALITLLEKLFLRDKKNEVLNDTNTQNNNGQALDDQNVAINDKSTDEGGTSTGKTRKVTYYNNYVMLGYIEIPVIRIKYPILEQETVASLEKAVAVRYPNSPQLNTVGNVVIVGHNYRNGMFFSNLKNVSVGDKIKITDTNGQTQVYTIYEKYETTPEDSTYITRDVGENIEITLVTCTDDSNARIIVKAKV